MGLIYACGSFIISTSTSTRQSLTLSDAIMKMPQNLQSFLLFVNCLRDRLKILMQTEPKTSKLYVKELTWCIKLGYHSYSPKPGKLYHLGNIFWCVDKGRMKSTLEHTKSWFMILRLYEPAHEIMVLFVLRKLILQTRMRSHPVGLDVWFLVGPFVYFNTLCVRTAKALARQRICAGRDCIYAQASLSLHWSPLW